MKNIQKITDTINAWSYSRLQTWRQCPFKAKLLMIDRLKEPTNAAMERGSNIHKKLENFMNTSSNRTFKEMGVYKGILKDIKKNKEKMEIFQTEMQVAFNKSLETVDWFAADAWLRGIFDLYIKYDNNKALIVDYKTGRRKDEHIEQADMYAALFYILNKDTFDKSGILTVQFMYVDDDKIENMLEKEYNIKTCEKYLKHFKKMGEAMTQDKAFVKKPSNSCKWCHFRKSNGGPCNY